MSTKDRIIRTLRTAFLGLGLALCVYGAASGEMETVLRQAINICMECIGLG